MPLPEPGIPVPPAGPREPREVPPAPIIGLPDVLPIAPFDLVMVVDDVLPPFVMLPDCIMVLDVAPIPVFGCIILVDVLPPFIVLADCIMLLGVVALGCIMVLEVPIVLEVPMVLEVLPPLIRLPPEVAARAITLKPRVRTIAPKTVVSTRFRCIPCLLTRAGRTPRLSSP
jgi:hypothetical protein